MTEMINDKTTVPPSPRQTTLASDGRYVWVGSHAWPISRFHTNGTEGIRDLEDSSAAAGSSSCCKGRARQMLYTPRRTKSVGRINIRKPPPCVFAPNSVRSPNREMEIVRLCRGGREGLEAFQKNMNTMANGLSTIGLKIGNRVKKCAEKQWHLLSQQMYDSDDDYEDYPYSEDLDGAFVGGHKGIKLDWKNAYIQIPIMPRGKFPRDIQHCDTPTEASDIGDDAYSQPNNNYYGGEPSAGKDDRLGSQNPNPGTTQTASEMLHSVTASSNPAATEPIIATEVKPFIKFEGVDSKVQTKQLPSFNVYSNAAKIYLSPEEAKQDVRRMSHNENRPVSQHTPHNGERPTNQQMLRSPSNLVTRRDREIGRDREDSQQSQQVSVPSIITHTPTHGAAGPSNPRWAPPAGTLISVFPQKQRQQRVFSTNKRLTPVEEAQKWQRRKGSSGSVVEVLQLPASSTPPVPPHCIHPAFFCR